MEKDPLSNENTAKRSRRNKGSRIKSKKHSVQPKQATEDNLSEDHMLLKNASSKFLSKRRSQIDANSQMTKKSTDFTLYGLQVIEKGPSTKALSRLAEKIVP